MASEPFSNRLRRGKAASFDPRLNCYARAFEGSHPARRGWNGLPELFGAAAIILGAACSVAQAASPTALPSTCSMAPAACGVNKSNIQFLQSGAATQAVNAAGNTMTVTQSSNAAILNWASFNVAKGNTVNFILPSNTAETLNRIWDGNPSTIAGAINSYYGSLNSKTGLPSNIGGQIYLINQSGIIFANGAQIDVGSLTASTLDITNSLFTNGLLSQNTLTQETSGQLLPVFSAANNLTLPGTTTLNAGAVTVNAGAQLTAADGGRIMLLGSAVTNNGSITTPDGQTILGAGKTVYLAATTDPTMRGLLIEVDQYALDGNNNQVTDTAPASSTVTNGATGSISSPRGNVTLAGLVVNQNGLVSATSSVNDNGSISLIAGDVSSTGDPSFYNSSATGLVQGQMLPNSETVTPPPGSTASPYGGVLTLGSGSVTTIEADTTSTATITDAQTFYPSQINLIGQTVALMGTATVRAPGATVNVLASADPFNYAKAVNTHSLTPGNDGSTIYLDSGSTIDVSGLTNVSIPASENMVQIELGANELQDDPLQRSGFLHGQTVTVDLAVGSPLLNAATLQSYADTVGRSIQEKLTVGGTINLNSAGEVVARSGSTLNVSGGSVAAQSGLGPAPTELLGANGIIYNIGDAPTDIQYVAIANSGSFTDTTANITQSHNTEALLPGYIQGSDAGTIDITGAQIYLRGSLLGQTVTGINQRQAGTLPAGGTLVIGDSSAAPLGNFGDEKNEGAPSILLQNGATDSNFPAGYNPSSTVQPVLPTEVLPNGQTANDQDETIISPSQLSQSGFSSISLNSNGSIMLPAGQQLNLAGNGVVSFTAQSISVDGVIRAPGSAIFLSTNPNFVDLVGSSTTPTVLTNNDIVLGSDAGIDTSGTWVNDSTFAGAQAGTGAILINGGSVSLKAYGNVMLDSDSLINVSGGGWENSSGKLSDGAAGSILLAANVGQPNNGDFNNGVTLGGALLGASLDSGGSLSISSASVTVGGTTTGTTPGELPLTPDFFTEGGFKNYSISGIQNVTIGSGAAGSTVTIQPTQQNLVLDQNPLLQATGSDLLNFTQLETLPAQQRGAASVSFAATGSAAAGSGPGNLVLNANTVIQTDPGGSVSLSSANGNLSVYGNIVAPAGTINLQVSLASNAASSSDTIGYVATQQLLIGSSAQLSALGFDAIYTDNPQGYLEGQVLSGGTINVLAYKGSVVAQSGANLNVSAADGTVDIINSKGVTPTLVAGAAGNINIDARENLVLNANLEGKAAPVAGAGGGSLSIGLDLYSLDVTNAYNSGGGSGTPFPTNERNLTITSLPVSSLSDALPATDGTGTVSTGAFANGGFSNLSFRSADIITLDGATTKLNLGSTSTASLTLDAPELAATAGTTANVTAAYVALGNSQYFAPGEGEYGQVYSPASGNATLDVSSELLDIRGYSVLSGFGTAAFNSTGDIRLGFGTDSNNDTDFTGSLESTANLSFDAAQIYPVTNAQFTINPADLNAAAPTLAASYSYIPGTVTIANADPGAPAPGVPLSALGSLTIDSSSITQSGVLRAPLGQISLNGISDASTGQSGTVTLSAGSLTSVSADGLTIPYGSTENGSNLTYLVGGTGSGTTTDLITGLPAKQINLNGNTVKVASGASLDLSGGGDLYAYEFIAGTGGSMDVLAPGSGVYSYAIVPSLSSQYAPIDHQYGAGTNIPVGQDIYISGVPGLAAGYYALLPARYALLPGAYAVSLVQSSSDLAPGTAVKQANGSYLVAGQFAVAGTDIYDSRTSTFLLAPNAVVNTQSQYTSTYANAFFNSAAIAAGTTVTNLPVDAGQLQLGATGALSLDGTVSFTPGQFVSGQNSSGDNITQTGRGGDVSIEAANIEVVNASATPDGSLQLTASSLDALGASSIILGATRTTTSSGDQLNVAAGTVTVENSASDPLTAPEIILAATGKVELDPGSAIVASGTSTVSDNLLVNGDGAVLRVSSGPQVTLSRSDVPAGAVGTLAVDSGATISGGTSAGATLAAASLILDAAANTTIASDANISAQAVDASSSQISLGAVPAGTTGLNFTSQLLADLTGLTALTLHSDTTINFYGPVQLGTLNASGAPVLQSITLDARGIGGYGGGNTTVEAGSITLSNAGDTQTTAPFAAAPNGSGQLTLTAVAGSQTGSGQINLGAGDKDIQGFSTVNLNAAGDLRAQASGTLSLTNAGDLQLTAARLSTDGGATQSITNNSGAVIINPAGSGAVAAAKLPPAGLGGELAITGTSITQNGFIDLPAGIVSLQASTGNVTLGSGSVTEATGAAIQFFNSYAVASGGTVSLAAAQGNVSIASGATVNVSGVTAPDGVTTGDAGSLSVLAPNGEFTLGGTINGAAPGGKSGGSFMLAVNDLGNFTNGFSDLNSALSSGGFFGAVSETIGTGNVTIASADTVKASSFSLTANQGAITVAGTVDTSGGNASSGNGGTIGLWSSGNLTVSGTLNSAAGTPVGDETARGGDVTLGSSAGMITLTNTATVNLSGQSSTNVGVNPGVDPDGQLLLRAPYNVASNTVNVNPIAATIVSSQPATVVVDAVTQYSASSLDMTALTSDEQAYANLSSAGLAPAGAAYTVQVRPAIEVDSTSDLTVTDTLNLNALEAGGVPIDLTLRAAGDLVFDGSLTDGFTTSGSTLTNWVLSSAPSGSYQLAAGANLASANPLATVSGTGNFILTPGNLIRTGTGNIAVAAGGEVCLGCDSSLDVASNGQTSVIYTAGSSSSNGLSDFTQPKLKNNIAAQFPVNGGNVSINAGGDVVSAPTTDLVSNWLWRQGAAANGGFTTDTAWWIEFSQFQQGVGALGGGNVSVQAGGDISNLSAVIPTTGRLGYNSATGQTNLVIDGGGNLSIQAGGNINGGLYEDDLGHAAIISGGAVQAAGTSGSEAPTLVQADSSFDVQGRTGASIAADFNSTALPMAVTNENAFGKIAINSYFYTYSPSSTVSVTSIAGDTALPNDANGVIFASSESGLFDGGYLSTNVIYPASVNALAFSGNISVDRTMELYPAPSGNLRLLAQGNVDLSAGVTLSMSEADPAQVNTVFSPAPGVTLNDFVLDLDPLPTTPLHQNDSQPVMIVAQTGSIIGATGDNISDITLPKFADLVAGGSISNINYAGKNLNPSDVTLFEAGGTILFATPLNPVNNQLASNSDGITVGGPGFVEALAGGAINLGDGTGIVTSGDLNDVRLPSTGATLVVAAGLGTNADGTMRQPDASAFITSYLSPSSSGTASIYASTLDAYMSQLYPATDTGLSNAQALTQFQALTPQQQLPLISQVLTDELNATGLAHTQTGADYSRGYNAISTLFPTKDAAGNALAYSGDIDLFFSQLKTEQGGDIDLMAPGGAVVVGVPNPPAELSTLKQDNSFNPPLSADANLGLLVLSQGAIQGFANGNFDVNQSRILTLQGGDIILWSSYGSIDAGEGAKTAQGAPPPVVETDANGNVFVNPVGDVNGSGIGQLLTSSTEVAGIVDLIAPTGVVNAGDAGIRVAGNLNIAATAVLNAGNIKVGGTSTGLPASDSGALAGALSGAGSLGDAGKAVANALEQTLSDAAASSQQLADSMRPQFVQVNLFCLGEKECENQ